MFTQACASVAMANAPEIVKQRATAMGPGNDEESVAWGLTKVVFEKDLP